MDADEPFGLYNRITKTATNFIDDYVAAHAAKDPTILSAHLASTCNRRIAPAAFIRHLPPEIAAGWSNHAYEAHMRPELDAYSKVEAKIERLTVDAPKREAIVHSRHFCTQAGLAGRVWEFEFIFMLRFNVDGGKVTDILEFIDTATAGEFMAAQRNDLVK